MPDHDRAWRDVSSLPRPGSLRVAPPAGVILMLRLAAPINISTGAARHRRRVWLRSDGYARNGFFQSVWSLWLPSELNHPAPRRWRLPLNVLTVCERSSLGPAHLPTVWPMCVESREQPPMQGLRTHIDEQLSSFDLRKTLALTSVASTGALLYGRTTIRRRCEQPARVV